MNTSSSELNVVIFLPHYSSSPTPHAARMNDVLSRFSVVASDIKCNVVSISAIKGDTQLIRLINFIRKAWEGVRTADIVHIGSFTPCFPLIWLFTYGKPVILGPNITGAAFPKRFLSEPAIDAIDDEMRGYRRRWLWQGKGVIECFRMLLGRRATAVLTLSGYASDIISSRGMKRELMMVLPFAARLAEDNFPSAMKQVQRDVKYVAYVGRLDRRKGFDIFVSMIRLMKDDQGIKFVIAGDGRLSEELSQLLAEDSRVIYLGKISRSVVLSLFKQVDVYVQPSTYEAVATTLFESLRASVPVVSSDIASAKEVFLLGGVTLFPVGSIGCAVARLRDVLMNLEKETMNAAKAAQCLELDSSAEWLASLYRGLASGGKSEAGK